MPQAKSSDQLTAQKTVHVLFKPLVLLEKENFLPLFISCSGIGWKLDLVSYSFLKQCFKERRILFEYCNVSCGLQPTLQLQDLFNKGPFTIHCTHSNGTVTIGNGHTLFERINICCMKIRKLKILNVLGGVEYVLNTQLQPIRKALLVIDQPFFIS